MKIGIRPATCLAIFFLLISIAAAAQVRRVARVTIPVGNMNISLPFYRDVLGFVPISDTEKAGQEQEDLEALFGLRERSVVLRLGDEEIELVDYLTAGGRPVEATWKSNDLAFQHLAIVVRDMDSAYRWLRLHAVEQVSTGPQTLPPSIPEAAGVRAFYFHDPDQHNLELIWFPEGKGLAKWHEAGPQLFLGIDHTAIAVGVTRQSLSFYQQFLGIPVKGESWNKGIEQEHLNNVEAASLHITGLRAAAGPGIEFLQYLEPGGGRPYPQPSQTQDLWSWQTVLLVDDPLALYQQVRREGYAIVSRKLVTLRQGRHTVSSFLMRDPDGHLLRIEGITQ